jgi:hypothetical protein
MKYREEDMAQLTIRKPDNTKNSNAIQFSLAVEKDPSTIEEKNYRLELASPAQRRFKLWTDFHVPRRYRDLREGESRENPGPETPDQFRFIAFTEETVEKTLENTRLIPDDQKEIAEEKIKEAMKGLLAAQSPMPKRVTEIARDGDGVNCFS